MLAGEPVEPVLATAQLQGDDAVLLLRATVQRSSVQLQRLAQNGTDCMQSGIRQRHTCGQQQLRFHVACNILLPPS